MTVNPKWTPSGRGSSCSKCPWLEATLSILQGTASSL